MDYRLSYLSLPFSQQPSLTLHIDLNSCFATIEQQANPLFRGKPLVVAAYASPRGCIVAPSIEAKKLGIKVGFRVKDAQAVCPNLIVIEPDPDKYRFVHARLRQLLCRYTTQIIPKSIDEFVLNFSGFPGEKIGLHAVASEIKSKIKQEIGDWLTVSIGIAPNRFLAKLASNLKKPDGLEEINSQNFMDVYSRIKLDDLPGINQNLSARLNSSGIHSVVDLYLSDISKLKSAFKSIVGFYWYVRLRGWEIDDVDFSRKSFGHMYSLPRPVSEPSQLTPILSKLVEKMSFRLRRSGYKTRGIHLGILYRDHSFWHRGVSLKHREVFSANDIYRLAYKVLLSSPCRLPVANISVSCFDLIKNKVYQLDLFESVSRKINLCQAIDDINSRYGNFVIAPARMIDALGLIPDRIGFGNTGDI